MSNYSFIMRKYHNFAGLMRYSQILTELFFLQLKLLHHASHVTEQLRIFHLQACFAAVLLLTLYCWLPESTKRTESHSVLVRDVLVKHRVIVGNSQKIASQNASRQRQKAFCDGIFIENFSALGTTPQAVAEDGVLCRFVFIASSAKTKYD